MDKLKRGKLIYQPKGAAAEYAKWACNLYNGCSNRCEYCYNRHSQGSKLLGKDEPTIKGGMSEEEALDLFKKEFYKFEEDIKRDGGLFFNFVSDPCIPETFELNFWCIDWCVINRVPVILLTKNADWIYSALWQWLFTFMGDLDIKYLINFGFTLTGRDDLEPGASSNKKRIESIACLDNWGFRTWASIEPIIDPFTSYDMFKQALPYCEEFRFGLNSLKMDYSKSLIREFKLAVEEANQEYGRKLVWKESVLRFIEEKKYGKD